MSALAFGLGSVWVADSGGTVSRIDPRTGEVVETIVVGKSRGRSPPARALSGSPTRGDDTVSRIDPSNVVTADDSGRARSRARSRSAPARSGSPTRSTTRSLESTRRRTPSRRRSLSGSSRAESRRAQKRCGSPTAAARLEDRPADEPGRPRRFGSAAAPWAWPPSRDRSGRLFPRARPSRRHAGGDGRWRRPLQRRGQLRFHRPGGRLLPDLLAARVRDLREAPQLPRPAGARRLAARARGRAVAPARVGRTASATRSRSGHGYRFSPPSNERVTAQTFKYSIERSLSPKLKRAAVAPQFVGDIVGAKAYREGRAEHISGVVARGNTPDDRFDARRAGLPGPARDAVLLRRADRHPSRPERALRRSLPPGPTTWRRTRRSSRSCSDATRTTAGRVRTGSKRSSTRSASPKARTVAQIEAGRADYAADGVPPADASRLAARYGAGSEAAKAGSQRYFTEPILGVAFLGLNTSRPLFADADLRKAVNYAIDRPALARQKQRPFSLSASRPTNTFRPGSPALETSVSIRSTGPTWRPRNALPPARRPRRPLHLQHRALPAAGADRPDEPEGDRHRRRGQGIPLRRPLREVGTRASRSTSSYTAGSWTTPIRSTFLNDLLDGTRIKSQHNQRRLLR